MSRARPVRRRASSTLRGWYTAQPLSSPRPPSSLIGLSFQALQRRPRPLALSLNPHLIPPNSREMRREPAVPRPLERRPLDSDATQAEKAPNRLRPTRKPSFFNLKKSLLRSFPRSATTDHSTASIRCPIQSSPASLDAPPSPVVSLVRRSLPPLGPCRAGFGIRNQDDPSAVWLSHLRTPCRALRIDVLLWTIVGNFNLPNSCLMATGLSLSPAMANRHPLERTLR